MKLLLSKINFIIKRRFDSLLDYFSVAFIEDSESFFSDQNLRYSQFGLDRRAGLTKLNEVLVSFGLEEYDERNGMYSEHMVLFAALSVSKTSLPLSILEIGTWNGSFTKILSGLFPGSDILTIDLPAQDHDFVSSYGRTANLDKFLALRAENLTNLNNVKFVEMNSMMLSIEVGRKFDLVWVDGAHGYPTVACDIANTVRLLNENGICLVDDVWDNLSFNDKMYKSIGAFETLWALSDAGLIDKPRLFLKRLSPVKNIKRHQKFVAGFTKIRSLTSPLENS